MRSRYLLAVFSLTAVSLAVLAAAAPRAHKPATAAENDAVEPAADAAAEFVKIYRVADLVAATRVMHGTPAFSSRAEWSADIGADVEDRLTRLEGVVRLALPVKAGADSNSENTIASYPEKLSLVVRQTKAGHAAVEVLLSQLRAEDDFEIELQVEVAGLNSVKDKAEVIRLRQMLAQPLSSDEIAEVRGRIETALSASCRVREGHTCAIFDETGMPTRVIAVASADRKSIDVRVDHCTDDLRPDGTFPYATETKTIHAGKTASFLADCDGGRMILLVTPRIVPRS